MPPASPVAAISLRELADLAIGTPEVGAVNFTALHTLIVAILKNLHLQETLIDFQPPAPDLPPRAPASAQASISVPQLPGAKERSLSKAAAPQGLESQVRDLGGQVQDLNRQLKNIGSQVHGIVAHVQHLTQAGGLDVDAREWLENRDLASLMLDSPYRGSLKVLKDSSETSVSKTKELLQDVMEDVKTLKEAHLKVQEFSEMMPQKVMERIETLEKFIKDRDLFLEQVGRKLSLIPGGEEATMVTWEELEQAITDGWKSSQAPKLFCTYRYHTVFSEQRIFLGREPRTPARPINKHPQEPL
ncbi:uncharacterized protein LOC119513659 isoform X2 [Choloepus didactylus]|uniref:uncharacterized protein LOC119513659 isoform X2 n=2 Tax=Choloepus didactylus TaxID=27675 RepID=UPI00189ED43C|nr:uncharacterized protein LOC119513659 isoform X2 [Choloepus didactylus]